MNRLAYIFPLGFSVVLCGCAATNVAEREITAGKKLTAAARAEMAAIQRGEVIEVNKPYYGHQVKVERGSQRGKPLPKSVEGANSTSFNFTGDIHKFAANVKDQTGIPVSIAARFTDLDGNVISMPISTLLSLNSKGALSKALDIVGSRTDTDWSFDGSTIVFTRMTNRSYALSIPTGKVSFSKASSGLSGSGSSPISITRSGELDAWSSLTTRLANVVTPPSQAMLDQQSATLTVFGPPSVHAKVKATIDEMNALYAQKIGIEVAAFFVETSKVDDFAASISALSGTNSFTGLAQAISGNGVATIAGGGNSFNFRAISRDASVFDFVQGSSTSQSGVWAPIKIETTTNYVANAVTTTQDGVSSTSLQTASVGEGLSIHALPRILDGNKIQLHLTVVQRTLTDLDEFTTSTSSVQLPKIDAREIQSDVILASGETLLLAGYEQDKYKKSSSGPGSPLAWIAGGSKDAEAKNIRMILMVRPSILATSGRP